VNPDVERGSVGLALDEGVKVNGDGRGKVTLRGAFDSALPDVEAPARSSPSRGDQTNTDDSQAQH